jgi:hypothetical protein
LCAQKSEERRFGGAEPKDALKKAAECGVGPVAELASGITGRCYVAVDTSFFPQQNRKTPGEAVVMRCGARLRTAASNSKSMLSLFDSRGLEDNSCKLVINPEQTLVESSSVCFFG